jgi:pantoate--beta-alanine ligase
MRTLRTIREVRAALWGARQADRRIGLVPTMGAFHDGHVSLMRTARSECDVVVVSLFVNPTQFGAGEDFSRYPRNEGDDASIASDIGIDFLFAPSEEEMYPPGFASSLDPGPVATGLCGSARPGHFEGVATVVARLLGIVAPDVVYFGLKDYQQVAVVRRIIADLAMPIEMRALATVRDPDGLAMSSRNRFLTPDDRARAAALFAGLQAASAAFAAGHRDPDQLAALAREPMTAAGVDVEYLELRDAETLGAYTPARAALLAVAARVGGTRLIDNVVLTPTPAAARAANADAWSAR